MRCLLCFGLLTIVVCHDANGDDPSAFDVAKVLQKSVEDDFIMKTLGGRQFWGDVQFFQGWRIQQNVFTKHFRLLDADDNRHASGNLIDCQNAMNAIRTREKLPPMSGRVVFLVHGILRSSKCMTSFIAEARKSGLTPIPFDYPSTQISIPEAAEYLHQSIQVLEGIDEIFIVAHSMGGLVTRAYFAEHADPRIKRVVMIGTPNHGAELADLLHRSLLVQVASGPGGRQLVTNPDGLIPSLPVPKCEFAVIAGARGQTAGWNPFIPGDDDGTVTMESTRLVGAADFSTVSSTHTALLSAPETIEQALRFLKEGRLRADRLPQPIAEPISPETPPQPPP